MRLAAAQLTPTIECNILGTHSEPRMQGATICIERIDFLPNGYKQIINTFFGILRDANTI
jgi:hypothetical protein